MRCNIKILSIKVQNIGMPFNGCFCFPDPKYSVQSLFCKTNLIHDCSFFFIPVIFSIFRTISGLLTHFVKLSSPIIRERYFFNCNLFIFEISSLNIWLLRCDNYLGKLKVARGDGFLALTNFFDFVLTKARLISFGDGGNY